MTFAQSSSKLVPSVVRSIGCTEKRSGITADRTLVIGIAMGSRIMSLILPRLRLITALFTICLAAVSEAEVTTIAVLSAASNSPGGISVDIEENVYSADFGGSSVFKIHPDGSINLFATGFLTPSGNGFDSSGNFYQSNYSDPISPLTLDTISKITPEGIRTIFASGLDGPVGIAFDFADTMFVAVCNAQNVTRIGQDGVGTIFATDPGFACPNGITFDTLGNLYTCNFNDGGVHRITSDGTVSLLATLPGGGNGHLTYVAGWLYVGDRAGNQIYRIHVNTGLSELVAGTGEKGSQMDGPDLEAEIAAPNAVERNIEGSAVYINGEGNRVRKLTLDLPRPISPGNLRLSVRTPTRVRVRWEHSSLNREGFLIEAKTGSSRFEVVGVTGVNSRSIVIRRLLPSTEYIFRVRAFNGVHIGRPSERVTITTSSF